MKKSIFKKIGGLFLGLAMGLGVAAGVTAGNKASEVRATDYTSMDTITPTSLGIGSYGSSSKGIYKWTQLMKGQNSIQGNSSKSSVLWNTSAFSDDIAKIDLKITYAAGANAKASLSFGKSEKGTDNTVNLGNGTSYSLSTTGTLSITNSTSGCKYFTLTYTSGASYYAEITVYKAAAQNYTVSFAVGQSGYGTVSPTSIANVPSGSEITTNGNKVTINGTTVTATPSAPTAQYTYAFSSWSNTSGTVTAARTITANFTRTTNTFTVGGSITNGSLSSTSNVNYNAALDITIDPDQDYTYPSSIDSVTMGGAAFAGYTYDSSNGSFYIEHVTGNVVINATCVSTSATERFFHYHLTNCSIENAPESMYDTEMILLQIVADDHYKFPSSIAVTGISIVNWEYDADEGTILINEPDGDIDLTVECVAKAHYTISVSGDGEYGSHFSYSGHENGIYATESTQVTIAPDTSTDDIYVLSLSDISVTGASKDSYTNNVLTISNPTGAVTITVSPKLRTVTGIELISSPSTKTYNIGDSFSTNNWVVKQNYSDGTTGNENIVNQCDIVFDDNNPAAMFEEGSHTVKFVYNNMSTISTNITVNKVTHDGTVTFAKTNITTGKLLIATKDNNNNWYYLSTASATNAGPVKTSLTMNNGLPEFESTVASSTYMWNLTVSNGKYTIKNDSGQYLFANGSNSGLRVGSTSDTWTATATTNGYKLQETTNSRFLGVYVDGSDWRPYTSANADNYKGTGENIVFFTRTEILAHIYMRVSLLNYL